MVNFTIYAGGYVSFIASFLFDSDAGSLILLNKNPSGQSPSWLTPHPTNQSLIYATNENTQGAVQSFLIENGGVLSSPLDTASSGGNGPAFATMLSTGELAVMNYGSGDGFILPTSNDGATFGTAPLITFPVPASGASHPHMAYEYKGEVFVPDLGADTIYRLSKDESSGAWAIKGQVQQPAKSGPRHITIDNDILYTVHETASTLTSQTIPSLQTNSTPLISNETITPPNLPTGAVMAAAEILLPPASPSFPGNYIYVSNRNIGVQDPRGDSIAIYSFDNTGTLTFVNQVYTGLDQIRGMEFGGEDNKYLIAGGVAGTAGVVIFERIDGGSNMTEVVRNTDMPTATSFIWT